MADEIAPEKRSLDVIVYRQDTFEKRLEAGAVTFAQLTGTIEQLKTTLETRTKDTLKEHADANRRDNDRLEVKIDTKLEEFGHKLPKPIGTLKWAGMIGAVGLFMAQLEWSASGYARREELVVASEKLEAKIEALDKRILEIEGDRRERIAAAPQHFATRPEFDDIAKRLTALERELDRHKTP